jgi:hypothetical protein
MKNKISVLNSNQNSVERGKIIYMYMAAHVPDASTPNKRVPDPNVISL